MPATRTVQKRFSSEVLRALESTKYLYIRSGEHRFICIWVVVVDGRVIVRSWNNQADGWYRAFLDEPRGNVKFDKNSEELPIRAVRLRSARLNDSADEAYAAKYTTRSNQKYVEGFRSAKRKACTLELVPVAG